MKIGIVGCGAVGTYYGARLLQAEHDVHFLLRSDFGAVQQAGVRIESASGNFTVRPTLARSPNDIGPCDLVLIALKTLANHQFPHLLPPLLGAHTTLVTLQNGLGSDELLAAQFGPDRVGGGLCFIGVHRVAPGVVRHVGLGLMIIGAFAGRPGPILHHLADSLRQTGVPAELKPDLAAARWEKLVWNIPFNGLGIAAAVGHDAFQASHVPPGFQPGTTVPTSALLEDSRWAATVRELMVEVVASAAALGHPLPRTVVEDNLARTRRMGPYRPSTLLDYERGAPLELESIFLEPRRRARAAGVATPWLDRVCSVMQELANLNRP